MSLNPNTVVKCIRRELKSSIKYLVVELIKMKLNDSYVFTQRKQQGINVATLVLAVLVCMAIACTLIVLAWRAGKLRGDEVASGEVQLRDAKVVTLPQHDITNALPPDVVIGEVAADNGTVAVEMSFVQEEGGKAKVVKQRSQLDNKFYLVASTLPDRERAADTLAEINRRSKHLVHAIKERLDLGRPLVAPDGINVTRNMARLVEKHAETDIPFAEYHSPSDKTVGSNADKGVLIEMCLRSKYDTKLWNPLNTLTRVHVHELAHSADFEYRQDGEEAHGPDFYRLMNYLLKTAEDEGLYNCAEYKATGGAFCGLRLTENDVTCG